MIIGILFVIIEIFDPAFFFISLGVGAIVTGLVAMLPIVERSIPLQILIFAICSFIAFLFMRKLGKKVLAHPAGETNVFALKGKSGHITQAIEKDGRGYVKVGGEEWVAISQDGQSIDKDAKVEIIEIDGNKLIVKQS
ncbi:MAG: NfeD family protein [Candidatus Cloacimonetes bacterium]|nr:NfeD family protein [Candidatus Cloacimonadota bacterium]